MAHPQTQALLESALSAQRRGDVAAAVRGYEAVLKAEPVNPHALNSLGMMALNARELPKAEAFFRSAIAADPAEPALWLNLANAQRQQGDDAGERTSLDAALAIDQRHFMALLRKAELLERLEERGGAAQAWSGVVALAAQANDLPPALTEAVRHGQAYIAAHADVLSAALDAGLSEARAGLSRKDLRRFDAAVDVMLGKRRIYRNEAHGVEFPFLPADEFFDRDFFPWMPALEAQTGAIREELRALLTAGDGPLRPYVAMDAGTPANKWTPLDHSLDWGAMFLWEYGARNDALCARCPVTAAALEAIPRAEMVGRAPSAFFSLLKPRTHIPPHSGVTNLRTIIHLPLIVPAGCTFRVGGETRAWREGEALAFDDSIEHEARNDSDDLRAVLIFDVWNPWLTEVEKRLVQTMFAVSDASGLSPQQERGAGF